ncbi:hypothetical protein F4803DRAFT_568292 [Xylaria telfairii]|nr:hypothetical protein F4803DRAFT_568292 [Xylaria telfairii]
METNNEESTIAQTSDETLSDLRELSIQCRELLHHLSVNNRPTSTDGAEARELMANFNTWAANMGVFREGLQSLNSRLKSAPDISKLVQQLLIALQRSLEKILLRMGNKDDSPSTSESDDSSDRSSTSSRRQDQTFGGDKACFSPRSTVWTSIHNTITGLRQLELTVRQAGAQHRQERIDCFKNLPRNEQVHKLFEDCARQKVDYLFPKVSEVLQKRMVVSIVTRRARFLYLEQHQKKTSTLNEPAPELPQNKAAKKEEEMILPTTRHGQKKAAYSMLITQPSEVLSNTVVTKLDLKRLNLDPNKTRSAESVSSAKISTGTFPSVPKLDPGGISFTCPYCFLVCPAKEASGQSQWMRHLIYDFELFFCVFDDCSSPFTCAGTYTGWLAHMRDTHTQPTWHCWHCKTAASSSGPFLTPGELESHLEKHHQEEATDPFRPTLIKHSMIRDQYALQECPFCGGFPEEIEKKYDNRICKQARESLSKHVRDHLISVALILAPVETGELGSELDDTKSEAQRDNDSERSLHNVGNTYELECMNNSCDCQDIRKNSVLNWSIGPDHNDLEMKDMQAVSKISQLWRDILDEKMSDDRTDATLYSFAAKAQLEQSHLRPSSVESPSLFNTLNDHNID